MGGFASSRGTLRTCEASERESEPHMEKIRGQSLPASTRRSRRVAIIASSCIIGLIGSSMAFADIPDSTTGVITACYPKWHSFRLSGMLRVIDAQSGDRCKWSETTLTWNQEGPAGPAGTQGDAGPERPPGDAGTAGPQRRHRTGRH